MNNAFGSGSISSSTSIAMCRWIRTVLDRTTDILVQFNAVETLDWDFELLCQITGAFDLPKGKGWVVWVVTCCHGRFCVKYLEVSCQDGAVLRV